MLSTFEIAYVDVRGDIRTLVTLASSVEHARRLCLENVYGVYKIFSIIEKPRG